MAHYLASDIIVKSIKERESLGEIIAETDKNQIIAERDKNLNKQDRRKYPILLPAVKHIHEMERRENGDWYCLTSFTKPELPPEWLDLRYIPPGLSFEFYKFLKAEYEKYAEDDPYGGPDWDGWVNSLIFDIVRYIY